MRSHDLLQDVRVQGEVGNQPLELAVLLAQLPQLAQTQIGVLLLPDLKGRVADAVLATDLAHPGAGFRLAQHPQNLLFAVTLSYPSVCLPHRSAEDQTSYLFSTY